MFTRKPFLDTLNYSSWNVCGMASCVNNGYRSLSEWSMPPHLPWAGEEHFLACSFQFSRKAQFQSSSLVPEDQPQETLLGGSQSPMLGGTSTGSGPTCFTTDAKRHLAGGGCVFRVTSFLGQSRMRPHIWQLGHFLPLHHTALFLH